MSIQDIIAPQYGRQQTETNSADRWNRRVDGQAHRAMNEAAQKMEKGDRSGWDFVVDGITKLIVDEDLRKNVKLRFFEECPSEFLTKDLTTLKIKMEDGILYGLIERAQNDEADWDEVADAITLAEGKDALRQGVKRKFLEACPDEFVPAHIKFDAFIGIGDLEVRRTPSAEAGRKRALADAKRAANRAARHAKEPPRGSHSGGNVEGNKSGAKQKNGKKGK